MNFSPAPPATLIIETTKTPPLSVAGPHSSDPADKTLKWQHLFKLSTEDGGAAEHERKIERKRRERCVAFGCRQAGLWNAGMDGVETGESDGSISINEQ